MEQILGLITQLVTLISAVIGIILLYRKAADTHNLINSRMDEMLKLARQEAKAEGSAQGIEQEQARVAKQTKLAKDE